MSNKDATHNAIELSPTHEILIGQRPTQDSVALAFAQLYAGTYVYAYPTGWLKWTGKLWQTDVQGDIREDIRNLTRRHNREGLSSIAASGFIDGVVRLL